MADIAQIFEDYADTQGWGFAQGTKAILNYEISKVDLTDGKRVLFLFPFIESGIVDQTINTITGWNISTQLWLGGKFDQPSAVGSKSNLDETYKQKDDRRLKVLREELKVMLRTIFCGVDIDLVSVRVTREINKTDENLDFVVAEVVFKDET